MLYEVITRATSSSCRRLDANTLATNQETVISPGLSVSVYGEEGGLLAMTEASVNLTAISYNFV